MQALVDLQICVMARLIERPPAAIWLMETDKIIPPGMKFNCTKQMAAQSPWARKSPRGQDEGIQNQKTGMTAVQARRTTCIRLLHRFALPASTARALSGAGVPQPGPSESSPRGVEAAQMPRQVGVA